MESSDQNRSPAWMTEEHILLRDAARKFFAAEVAPQRDRWRKQGMVDREIWPKLGAAGLLGASVPEAYGGSGGDTSHDAVIFLEHAGTGDYALGLRVQVYVIHYVLAYGSEEQKQRWLPSLIAGEQIAAIAMSEPNAGTDLQAVESYAVKDGDDYVLNGSKTFISNGQIAGLVCVVCKTDRNARAKGISLLMLETEGLAGFRRGRNLEKIGMKGQDTSELFFEDVRVSQDCLLGGEEGRGFGQLMKQLPRERLSISLTALAACDLALRETLAYVKERKLFGKRLMDMQNTRFKLAEVKTKTEVLRTFLYECIGRLRDGTLDASTAAMAKWWSTQTQCEVVDECLQLHGGYGYMLEYPIAQLYTDSRGQKIYGGANEVMKEVIARSLDA
ncbi:MAG TPA: acyl-CoA dehydrogenase [Candidatus Hydrogenedentes bacterium]|nr:acyl-CoA dehydrogenase [Candidatus Hydrogenedentota bacterium]